MYIAKVKAYNDTEYVVPLFTNEEFKAFIKLVIIDLRKNSVNYDVKLLEVNTANLITFEDLKKMYEDINCS